MFLLAKHTEAVCARLDKLKNSRYKVLVICGDPISGKTTLARGLCDQLGAHYIDVTTELLPHVKEPVLGAFGPSHFLRWIAAQSEELSKPICFDEIEPLVATFGEQETTTFFQILKNLEVRHFGLVFTRLRNALARAGFPQDHTYFLAS